MPTKLYLILLFLFPLLCLGLSQEEYYNQFKAKKINPKKFFKAYELKSCSSGESDGSITESQQSSNACYFFSGLQSACQQAKEPATACCTNPNACTAVMADVVKNILPALPGLYATIQGIKTQKEVNKGNLSAQEAQEKLCNVGNQVQMGNFAGQLLSQVMPMFEKGCAGKIKKCKQSCTQHVDNFKKDFFGVYSAVSKTTLLRNHLLVGKRKINIRDSSDLISLAKECLFGQESFENIHFEDTTAHSSANPSGIAILVDGRDKELVGIIEDGPCRWSYEKTAQPKGDAYMAQEKSRGMETKLVEEKLSNAGIKILSEILFATKAYYESIEKPKNSNKPELFRWTEKEVVDCAHQPNRTLGRGNNRPGGPITPPMIQMCKNVVENAVNNTQPRNTAIPSGSSGGGGSQGTNDGAGSFTGTGFEHGGGGSGNPLLFSDEDSSDGDDTPLHDWDDPKGSGFVANPPIEFGSEGSAGGGSSGGGGGLSGGGAGSFAGAGGPEDPIYDDSGGGGDIEGAFSDVSGDYGSPADAVADAGPGGGLRSLSGDDKESKPSDLNDYSDSSDIQEEDMENGGSIFQLASQRIQNFCSDRSCAN